MSPELKPRKPVDIYCRASRDQSGEESSVTDQERVCREILAARGLQVGEVFVDNNVSGGLESRPAWDALMTKIDHGESGGLIALNLSRIGRHGRVDDLIVDLESKGAVVILTDGEIDTQSAQGRLMLSMLTSFNRYFREAKSEEWRARGEHRALAGKAHGPAPVGYSKSDGRLVPNEDADAVREAFRMKASGRTNREIADFLNAAVPTRSKKDKTGETVVVPRSWSDAAVAQLISNRTFLGEIRYGDIVTEGAHDALVDDATFRVANAKAGGTKARRSDGPILGDGLLRCSVCGSAMVLKPGGTNGQQLSWVCSSTNRTKGERHPTAADHLIAPYIFVAASERIVEWLKSEPAATKIAAVDDITLEALALARADVEALDAQLASGEIAATVYAKAATVAAARVEDLEAQVASAEGERVVYTAEQQLAVETLTFLSDYIHEAPYAPSSWDTSTVRKLRAAIRNFLGSVTISPGRDEQGKIRPVEERVTFEK